MDDRRLEGETGATWVQLSQSPARSILHHEKGRPLFHGKLVDAHNVGMIQASEHLGLGEEMLDILILQSNVQHFEGGAAFQIDVLTKIDFREATSPEQTQEAVVAKLLTSAIWHGCHSPER